MWSNVAAHPAPVGDWAIEADPDHFRGIAGEGEVTQQPPPRAVGGGVESPGRAGPRDPQPQGIAVHLEGVAVVRGSPGHDRDRGRPQLRRVLEAELGPLPLGRVQQQDPRVVHAAELHADLRREREIARRRQGPARRDRPRRDPNGRSAARVSVCTGRTGSRAAGCPRARARTAGRFPPPGSPRLLVALAADEPCRRSSAGRLIRARQRLSRTLAARQDRAPWAWIAVGPGRR